MPIAEQLAQNAGLRAGQSVLDVATGTGNAALAAARCGCEVTGVDYVEELLERGRIRAAAEGFQIEFTEGDAERLPYPDASFDSVLSCVGVMFTPDQERAAGELVRVCRPGGTIALANWTPTSFVGAIFRAVTRHVPPPAGVKPPGLWGTEERLRELFADAISDLQVQRREFVFRFRSGDEFVDFFRAWYGPVHKAFGALDDSGPRAAVRRPARGRRRVRSRAGTVRGAAVGVPRGHRDAALSRHSRAGARERPTASATSAREVTPSLAKTLARWPSTVFSARNSRLAISRFVRPSATCSAISRSRRLRCESVRRPSWRRARALTR